MLEEEKKEEEEDEEEKISSPFISAIVTQPPKPKRTYKPKKKESKPLVAKRTCNVRLANGEVISLCEGQEVDAGVLSSQELANLKKHKFVE